MVCSADVTKTSVSKSAEASEVGAKKLARLATFESELGQTFFALSLQAELNKFASVRQANSTDSARVVV